MHDLFQIKILNSYSPDNTLNNNSIVQYCDLDHGVNPDENAFLKLKSSIKQGELWEDPDVCSQRQK